VGSELSERAKGVVDSRKLLEKDELLRRAEEDKLAAIRAWFGSQSDFRFYGSSLLFVYDGAPPQPPQQQQQQRPEQHQQPQQR
jgi:hypothetical protein